MKDGVRVILTGIGLVALWEAFRIGSWTSVLKSQLEITCKIPIPFIFGKVWSLLLLGAFTAQFCVFIDCYVLINDIIV